MLMSMRLWTGDGRGDAGEMTTGSILPVRRGSREPVDRGFGRTGPPRSAVQGQAQAEEQQHPAGDLLQATARSRP